MTARQPHRPGRPASAFQIDALAAQHPQKAPALRELFEYFEARTFLPTLHDVNRFFERWSDSPKVLRARASAPPKLFALLAGLGADDLESILFGARLRAAGKSDLDIISDAILGTKSLVQRRTIHR